MRWVALLQPTETISGGIYFVQPAERGMSEMFLGQNKDKLFVKKNSFPRLCQLHFLFMKSVLFPDLVSADILYLFLPIFNIFPQPIYHQRSYFHMFLILMCWQFNFPKMSCRKRANNTNHFDQSIFHSNTFFEVDIWLLWENFQGRSHDLLFIIIVRI